MKRSVYEVIIAVFTTHYIWYPIWYQIAVFTTHTFGTRFGTKSGTKFCTRHFLQDNFLKQLSLQNNALRTHDNGK